MPTSFQLHLECNGLARMIHDGSPRTRADATRDGHSEA
jgi:hypothetical protein